ncbi:MAG: 4a-hydroxytetrahydrobiopterin dehydratase [Bdellovibrionales bacterium]|nr:4a-hydroxytetrahydrobiopterin dehydratase [Bdellovibrionales bacterium]
MNKQPFLSKKCFTCNEKTLALSSIDVRSYLKELSGWSNQGLTIEKTYVFSSFVESIEFVKRVAEVAENEGHHPDIAIHYCKVTLSLWTHVVKGLTENDFILAAKIDDSF